MRGNRSDDQQITSICFSLKLALFFLPLGLNIPFSKAFVPFLSNQLFFTKRTFSPVSHFDPFRSVAQLHVANPTGFISFNTTMATPLQNSAMSDHCQSSPSPSTERTIKHESVFVSNQKNVLTSDHTTFSSDANVATILIVLNRPISISSCKDGDPQDRKKASLFDYLWKNSCFRICADGGANRLYREAKANDKVSNMIPDLIVGDLDSIQDHVRKFYENQGCQVVLDPDQDSNDLDKAIQSAREFQRRREGIQSAEQHHSVEIEDAIDANGPDNGPLAKTPLSPSTTTKYRICVYGAFGGRFDQTMASIQALHKWSLKSVSETNDRCDDLVLYTEETSARLLLPDVLNEIHVDRDREGPCCGLIPVGAKCDSVWSDGLEWNLNESMGGMEFGGLVSTSNLILNDVVKVRCSQPLVWTTEMRGFGADDS